MLARKRDILLSASSFYFWTENYDLARYVEIIAENDIACDGIDLYFDAHSVSPFPRFNNASLDFLSKLNYRVLHTDFYKYDWRKQVCLTEFASILEKISNLADHVDATHCVIHADFLIKDPECLIAMVRGALSGIQVCLEIMDAEKYFAKTPEEMARLLAIDGEIGFVPDTAHMQDFNYAWEEVFNDDRLSGRIAMVQVSNHSKHLDANWYAKQGYEGVEAVHSLCIAKPENFSRNYLSAIQAYPIVIEGIVPPGERGIELLKQEIAFLTSTEHH